MKRLVLTLAIMVVFALGGMAQNIWKPINGTGILGASPDGSIFAYGEYGTLSRSQDDGESWQIVLGQETGFIGHINSSCFAVSPEGRICVFNDNQQTVEYSDDNGDTWQQTTDLSSCGMPTKAGICAPTNDIMVVWAENGEISYTLDGGVTWDGWILDFLENSESVSDLLVNENGDVYVSVAYYIMNIVGIYHSTLTDIQNWELIAFEGISVKDMAFDPDGNVVACGYNADGSSVGFQHIPGFYLFDGTSLAISDDGIVFTPHFMGLQAVLSYSTDHGEHFTELGEHLPLVDIAPGGENPRLFKGYDNHLYFDGGGEYWKSVRDADYFLGNFPLENTAWVQFYRSMYEDSTYYQLGIKGDTLVNEMAYKKVINCAHLGYPIEGECFGGIREDGDGKCYFMSFVDAIYAPWPLHYDCEANTEYPLYDFSLSVCDVFQTIGLTPHVVFDTAEMQLNGSTRKVFWFSNNCDNGNYYDYQWIEGIGSTHSLLYPIQDEPDNGPEYRLVEVWQDEELLYKNPHFLDYFPLVQADNNRQKWNVVYIGVTPNYPNDYHTEIQSIRDDINLDGVDYKLVWTEDVYDFKRIAGAVREEDKRVYFRRKIEQNYQEEVLLYDFNLMVGDTVTVNWMGQQLMVLEESEVEVDGTMRRQLGLGRYSVGYPPTEVDEYWIEGVGSTFGFLNSGSEGLGGAFIYLLCYHENGNLVWDNEAFEDCVMNSDGTLASFAPQGAEWYFHVLSQGPITEPPFSYINRTVSGVEEVQGHTCSVIDLYDYVYEEDDIVYWYNQANDAFTVLYDFNAEAGESWYCDIEECSFLVTVQSVDNVTWNNRTYRTQYVAGYYADNLDNVVFEGKIIDGIGYEKGLFPNWGSCGIICGADYEYMRCYLEDGELLYHEGDYDCDYVPGNQPQQPQFEWYYEIQNEDGSITYQYMYQAGDTIVQDEPTHILVKINTLYDKGLCDEVTHEYVYERDGKLYWWNKTLEEFTVLYDYEAEVGDSWEIKVGTRTLDMHVDAVEEIEYEGRTYRMLRVSDPEDLFSGNIVCGIGHLTSFFPERLMGDGDRMRVEGMRCYWNEGELVFKYGDEDCDAIYSEVHGLEEGGPSTPSTGSGTAGTFEVYPNPTNSILFVETRRATSLPDQTYHITNLMGQTLLTGQITDETQQIDVSSLPQGMYFITFAGETRKFVVR